MSASDFDVAVLGGGIMGATTALHLSEGGMRVLVLERGGLCSAASGVNAGTLSLQIKRATLIPYALKGWELWRSMSERFGIDIGFHQKGGLTVAFTEEEVEILKARMGERQAAGAPIEIIDAGRACELEPGLSERVVLASYCPLDGYANSTLTGLAYRNALLRAGARVQEGTEVSEMTDTGKGFSVRSDSGAWNARRLVLAGGAWLHRLGEMLGLSLPISSRVNQVSVTERCPPLLRRVLGHALGLLTLKQSTNGTVLIGGGWQGGGSPDEGRGEVLLESLIGNLRLAQSVVPGLRKTRLVRIWYGFEAHAPDYLPMVGPLAGRSDLFIIGCIRGGYTIGPYMGRLLADLILGRNLEMPLFDPNRFELAAERH